MQQQSDHPHRPVPLQGGSELQQLLQLVSNNQQQPRSAFNQLSQQQGFLPDFNLYHAAQLSGLLATGGQNNALSQLAQLQQLQNLQNQVNSAGLMNTPGSVAPPEGSGTRTVNRGNARGEKSSTAYASRHQAAEQRRRNRINDRLDLLRSIVPHSERANTATFLEEVIKYVGELQTRITMLESAQGLPLTCPPKPLQMSQQLSQQQQQQLSQSLGPQTLQQPTPKHGQFGVDSGVSGGLIPGAQSLVSPSLSLNPSTAHESVAPESIQQGMTHHPQKQRQETQSSESEAQANQAGPAESKSVSNDEASKDADGYPGDAEHNGAKRQRTAPAEEPGEYPGN